MGFCIAISISGLIILLFSLSNCHLEMLETIGRGSMAPYVLHIYDNTDTRGIAKCACQDFAVYVIAETVVAVLLSLIVIKIMERLYGLRRSFIRPCF